MKNIFKVLPTMNGSKFKKSSEQGNVKFGRSLYFIKDINAGDVITAEHVKSIRPGYGLALKYLWQLIGKKSLLILIKANHYVLGS